MKVSTIPMGRIEGGSMVCTITTQHWTLSSNIFNQSSLSLSLSLMMRMLTAAYLQNAFFFLELSNLDSVDRNNLFFPSYSIHQSFNILSMLWCCNSCNTGTTDAIRKMIRYEGFNGFYKGMSTKIVQSVLAAAVLFMVKEELFRGARWLLTKDPVNTMRSRPP